MFDAFRSRCESDRSWSERISRARPRLSVRTCSRASAGSRVGTTLRTYSARVMTLSCFARDEVGLVREEPGEGVDQALPRRARNSEVARRRDAAAGQVLPGLPGPPGARRPEQGEQRVEPLLAVESLVDHPRRPPADGHRRLGHRGRPRVLEEPVPGPAEGAVGVVQQRRRPPPGRGRGWRRDQAVPALEDLEVLVGRAAPPAPAPPEPFGPGPGRVLDPPGESARGSGACSARFSR